MDKKLIVSPSPHIHSSHTTQKLMRDVLIALVPTFIVMVFFYGIDALKITCIAVLSCLVFEYLIQRYMLKGSNSITDLSAVITGVLLAFNLPSSSPWWMVAIGSLVAIGVGKMSFGGIGTNIFNPALVGRVFLLISFPAVMTVFPASDVDLAAATIDATSGATPLTYVKKALAEGVSMSEVMDNYSSMRLLLGNKSGSIGETASFAIILGFLYMLYRRVITWHIPISIFLSIMVFGGVLWLVDSSKYLDPIFHLLTGGILLGAVFMATDYVTSPMSKKGMIIYGVGIGFLTIAIRTWGSYAEGISFAILLMNAATPLINKYTKPKRFGEKVKKQ